MVDIPCLADRESWVTGIKILSSYRVRALGIPDVDETLAFLVFDCWNPNLAEDDGPVRC